MTLKEELEILRGEPIEVFDGDPMDIPCIETSDPEMLCKNPVVSVHMITYNHEPYIRQAIEGVMMQKTDFEFELVIGEDASQDRTREICFEYQKKYPDKIRVLWWHENVSKFGGNGRRTRARCRGEFIALCEGDDYWIDPLKLQKQVDVMTKYPTVGYCFTGARVLSELPINHPRMSWVVELDKNVDGTYKFSMGSYRAGFVPRKQFWENRWIYPRTATVMFRRDHYEKMVVGFEIFNWRLRVGDLLLWYGFARISDAYYFSEEMAVYRISRTGICVIGDGINQMVQIDGGIERVYFTLITGGDKRSLINECKGILVKRMIILFENRKLAASEWFSLIKVCATISNTTRFYWMAYTCHAVLGRVKNALLRRFRGLQCSY